MKTTSATTCYFDCTVCGRYRFTFDHLVDREAGWWTRWVCGECGAGYAITKTSQPGAIGDEFDVVRAPEHDRPRRLALLRFRNPRENVTDEHDDLYAIIKTSVDPKNNPEEQASSEQYYVEEHSCPTNFDYVAFILGNDPDPHGMWKFLGLMPMWHREGPGGDTHEYLRHIRDAAPELYGKYFAGGLGEVKGEQK